MYQPYVITKQHELAGAGNFTLVPSGNYKIVGISIQQSATNSTSGVYCGTNGTLLVLNYGKDFPFNEVSYDCNNSIWISKTGNDNASFVISYYVQNPNIPVPTTYIIGEVEISTGSASAIHDALTVNWFFYALMLLFAGIWIGLYIFKK